MTKTFTTLSLTIFVLIVGLVKSQTIELAFGFTPNQEIKQHSLQKNKQLMTFSGSKELLRKLAQNGMENPKLTESEVTSTSKIYPGAPDEDGIFSVQMEFLERSDSLAPAGLLM
ncbi:unnamed protein product, partial [Chrysoparadoxa australica]